MKSQIISLMLVAFFSLIFSNNSFANTQQQENHLKVQKRILTKLLSDPLDHYLPPYNASGPIVIKTQLYINNIQEINQSLMQWKTQLTLTQHWTDNRLSFDSHRGSIRHINLPNTGQIWMVDTFFRNEIAANYHDVTKRNELLRVFSNGDVLYSTRITLTLFCPMDVTAEMITCSIELGSFTHSSEEIRYLWQEKDPVKLSPILYIPKFTLESYRTDYCNGRSTTIGLYSCLKADFIFRRQP